MRAPLAVSPLGTAQEADVGTPTVFWMHLHVPGAPRLVFDNRKPLSKKAYFRCVIAAAKLLAAGVTSFKSNRSTAFCACVLRHSKLPPRGKTTKQMQELVKGTNSEDQPVVQEALNECVPSAAPCRT